MPHPEARDLDLARKRLCEWLSTARPDARDLQVSEIETPSSTGFSSETLMFDTSWDEDGARRRESLVARLEPRGFCVFPHYDIPRQHRVLEVLAGTNVPVPPVRELEPTGDVLGVPFFVMERVAGRVPSDQPPYHVGGWVPELPPARREALWWSGLDAMARVHRLDWQALGLGFLDEPERGATPLAQQLHFYDEYFAWGLRRERYPVIERALRWLRANQPGDQPVALCWGDSRLANQIFEEERCVAILDWEMMRLGNPVDDLAWWIALDRCFSEGIDVPRLPGLPDRTETIERWQSLTGRDASDVAYYEVLGLCKFALIIARIGLQMKHYGALPGDHEMDVENFASKTLARGLAEVGAPA